MKYKIGQEYIFDDNFNIKSFGGVKHTIKKGDRGIVGSKGEVTITSGNCANRVLLDHVDTVEASPKYSTENISKYIFRSLNVEFNLTEILTENDIKVEHFIEFIEDALNPILK